MKYLAIVLMPTVKGLKSFKLSEIFDASLDDLNAKLNEDHHVCYQVSCSDTLKESYDFLQSLNVERDSTVHSQESLVEADLHYAVLAVSDDFLRAEPLKNYTRNVYVYYPDNHIHQTLNTETEANDKLLKDCRARVKAITEGEIVSQVERQQLEAESAAALEQHEELERRWKEYAECPLQSFEGPAFAVGHALTPTLPRIEEVSPVLKRSAAMVGAQLANFLQARRGTLFTPEAETQNDNNADVPNGLRRV